MDVFPFNVKVEDDTIETYNKLLEICRTNGDSVSARLFERILDEEQVHDNYFCNMANTSKRLGIPISPRSRAATLPKFRAAASSTPNKPSPRSAFIPSEGASFHTPRKEPVPIAPPRHALCIERLEGEGEPF